MAFAISFKSNLAIFHHVHMFLVLIFHSDNDQLKENFLPDIFKETKHKIWVRKKCMPILQPKKCPFTARQNHITSLETDKQDLSDTELFQILQALRCHKLYQQK